MTSISGMGLQRGYLASKLLTGPLLRNVPAKNERPCTTFCTRSMTLFYLRRATLPGCWTCHQWDD